MTVLLPRLHALYILGANTRQYYNHLYCRSQFVCLLTSFESVSCLPAMSLNDGAFSLADIRYVLLLSPRGSAITTGYIGCILFPLFAFMESVLHSLQFTLYVGASSVFFTFCVGLVRT